MPALELASILATQTCFCFDNPMPEAWVYILASAKNGTLYTGVTRDLPRRIHAHKEKIIKGFTSRYDVNLLVYYEHHSALTNAIAREKAMKAWKRQWKIELIEKDNPNWNDLYFGLNG